MTSDVCRVLAVLQLTRFELTGVQVLGMSRMVVYLVMLGGELGIAYLPKFLKKKK